MVIGLIIQVVDSVVMYLMGAFMKIFINWWRKWEIDYIRETIICEQIAIKAQHIGKVPQLDVVIRIANHSLANIKITRVFGELHIGSWRFEKFDSSNLLKRSSNSCYTWSPLIRVDGTDLKKRGGIVDIEVTLFPPIEFWLMGDHFNCSLYNAGIEIKCSSGKLKKEIHTDEIQIKDIEPIAISYKNIIRNKLGIQL